MQLVRLILRVLWAATIQPDLIDYLTKTMRRTNNPQLWTIKWWNEEFMPAIMAWKRSDPWYDIEVATSKL